ncbi:MAG: hypothetical protein ACYDC1_06320 [Limisphaerales bacterium]
MPKPKSKTEVVTLKAGRRPIRNLVVVSDTHCGCRFGLIHPDGATLDGGDGEEPAHYRPSRQQRTIHGWWEEFWNEWVPQATKGEPYAVVINGDAIEGVHHRATSQISHNLQDQADIAEKVLRPIVAKCEGNFYMVRGTPAHVGESAVDEEALAKRLGAIPNEAGQRARYDAWIRVGSGLVHLLHHIGTTSSSAHETSAVHAEMISELVEAARWRAEPPTAIVRSHRHSYIKTEMAAEWGMVQSIVTPAWQLKTPYAYKISGARLRPPQFGGVIIRQGDRDLYSDRRVWTIGRTTEITWMRDDQAREQKGQLKSRRGR